MVLILPFMISVVIGTVVVVVVLGEGGAEAQIDGEQHEHSQAMHLIELVRLDNGKINQNGGKDLGKQQRDGTKYNGKQ
jgi:hypothetical protein